MSAQPIAFRSRAPESPLRRAYEALCEAVAAREPLVFVKTTDYETFDQMLLALKEEDARELGGRTDLKDREIVEYRTDCGVVDFDDKGLNETAFSERTNNSLASFLWNYLDASASSAGKGAYRKRILVLRGIASELRDNPVIAEMLRAIAANTLRIGETVLGEDSEEKSKPLNGAAGIRALPPAPCHDASMVGRGFQPRRNDSESATPVKRNLSMPVFVVASALTVPEILEPFARLIRLPPPSREEVRQVALAWGEEHFKEGSRRREYFEKEIDRFLPYLGGLSEAGVSRALDHIADEGIYAGLRKLRANQKARYEQFEFLEFPTVGKNEDFIGLKSLQNYLRDVKVDVEKLGARPRGLLLVGMPGCGKSLVAKVASTEKYLDRTLIRMDIGRLLGRYVGESEERMRNALEIIDRAAPCILWVDEIEKAFAGLDSSDGTTRRMLGHFLTWLQERETDVYVIATANSLAEGLPPELLRRGRFDEIFMLLLPNEKERVCLFRFCCSTKRYMSDHPASPSEDGRKWLAKLTDDDYQELAKQTRWKSEEEPKESARIKGEDGTEGFSAVDIDTLVRNAVKKANRDETKDAKPSPEEAKARIMKILEAMIEDMRPRSQRARMSGPSPIKGVDFYAYMMGLFARGGYRNAYGEEEKKA